VRIGFLMEQWPPTLAGRSLAAFADHLVAIGHEVLVLTDRVPRGHEAPYINTLRTSRWMTRTRRARLLARALPERARELGCERTIAAGNVNAASLYWAQSGALDAQHTANARALASSLGPVTREDFPKAIDPHSLTGVERVRAECQAILMKSGAANIVVPSERLRAELLERWPDSAERIRVVPTGIDLERFRPWYGERATIRARLGPAFSAEFDASGREQATSKPSNDPLYDLDHYGQPVQAPTQAKVPETGTPLIAFIARDPELKGLPALTRALALMVDRPWRLVVAGTAHFSSIERYLLPFGPALHAPSPSGARYARRWAFMPQVDIGLLLRAANLTAIPTWRDARGTVTLASLATGRRVVTTLANSFADLVLDDAYPPSEQRITRSQNGSVLFDASNEALLAQAIGDELDRDVTTDPQTSYAIAKSTYACERRRVLASLERELMRE
jgi:glycosyltransferase involved in cell wall biosynthesis